MIRLRILDVTFENPIEPWEVATFRGAVIESAGRKNTLFHNHLKGSFRYAYPLIQYKRIGHKPHLFCIEEGVDEVHHFFENKQEGLLLGKRPYELKVEQIRLNKFNMQVWDKTFNYTLYNWLPLNQENYKSFKAIFSEMDQIEFLKKILTGNILSFAKGINWNVDKEIKLRIEKINRSKIISVKGIKRESFGIDFKTNVFLPNHLGFGKNASLGFGVVKQKRENNE
ncbi:MAG: hypothetical protein K8S16_00270 [Bacteroidales bacterium]|nr:hypothetical protein [Bacteroidales bacterium]